MSKVQVDTIDTRSGTATMTVGSTNTTTVSIPKAITLGASGTTVTVPSGATLDLSNATQTGVGGDNTPSFYAYIDSNFSVSHNTQTLVPFNQEVYDNGGCFNTSSSNATLNGLTCPPHGFCPNEAGYYYFNAQTQWNDLTVSQQASGDQEVIQIYTWFSSVGTGEELAYKYHLLSQLTENTNMIFYFNGTGNCMQMKSYQANSSSATKTVRGSGNPMTNAYTTYLHGFKLII